MPGEASRLKATICQFFVLAKILLNFVTVN